MPGKRSMPTSAARILLRLFASQHIYLIQDIYTKRMSKTCSIGLWGRFRNDTGTVPDGPSRTGTGLAIDRRSLSITPVMPRGNSIRQGLAAPDAENKNANLHGLAVSCTGLGCPYSFFSRNSPSITLSSVLLEAFLPANPKTDDDMRPATARRNQGKNSRNAMAKPVNPAGT